MGLLLNRLDVGEMAIFINRSQCGWLYGDRLVFVGALEKNEKPYDDGGKIHVVKIKNGNCVTKH